MLMGVRAVITQNSCSLRPSVACQASSSSHSTPAAVRATRAPCSSEPPASPTPRLPPWPFAPRSCAAVHTASPRSQQSWFTFGGGKEESRRLEGRVRRHADCAVVARSHAFPRPSSKPVISVRAQQHNCTPSPSPPELTLRSSSSTTRRSGPQSRARPRWAGPTACCTARRLLLHPQTPRRQSRQPVGEGGVRGWLR